MGGWGDFYWSVISAMLHSEIILTFHGISVAGKGKRGKGKGVNSSLSPFTLLLSPRLGKNRRLFAVPKSERGRPSS
jgi:hypothetical protein